MKRLLIGLIMIVAILAGPAQAVEPVKIGMITTLSTNAGYLGEEIRDGFQLAIEVKIMTGIVFSNVAIAVVPKLVQQDVIYVSANAGPSLLAGKGCHKNYFNVAYQNDNLDEVVGKYVSDAGFKNVYLLAPNYPAGKDHLAGFKRYYMQAVKDAAVGVKNGSQWTHDLNNPANRQFVDAFRKAYGRTPTLYASQGYDAARLLGSALKQVGGDVSDMDAMRDAIRKADFETVRGKFKFSTNQHPIQDIYIREVVKDADGNYTNKTLKKVFTDHSNVYIPECKMD
jgi:ABC-type branched-subunit amino acid transport system substrate-binding protein